MRFVNYISQLKSMRYIIAPFLKARKNDSWIKVKKQGKRPWNLPENLDRKAIYSLVH
jgi:hypothetical protein